MNAETADRIEREDLYVDARPHHAIVTVDDFNERSLEDMSAHVFVESGMFAILSASNVGLGTCGIIEGMACYTFHEAVSIILTIDKLLPSAPKYLQKRIRATRMSFAFAFGPEMEEHLEATAR